MEAENGIHTIRSSDGGGLTQITSNPGGDDVPGSWSPNGKRIVFQRFDPTFDYEGVFVVNLNGTGLKRILPPTMQVNCCTFDWSPQGNNLVFSRHVTPDVHSSLWIVHSDGSGLHEINVQAGIGVRRRERRSQRPRLQRANLVARRDDDRVREIPLERRRRRDLHR